MRALPVRPAVLHRSAKFVLVGQSRENDEKMSLKLKRSNKRNNALYSSGIQEIISDLSEQRIRGQFSHLQGMLFYIYVCTDFNSVDMLPCYPPASLPSWFLLKTCPCMTSLSPALHTQVVLILGSTEGRLANKYLGLVKKFASEEPYHFTDFFKFL